MVFGELEITDLMTAMLTGAVVLARYTFFSVIVMAISTGQRSIDPLRKVAASGVFDRVRFGTSTFERPYQILYDA